MLKVNWNQVFIMINNFDYDISLNMLILCEAETQVALRVCEHFKKIIPVAILVMR